MKTSVIYLHSCKVKHTDLWMPHFTSYHSFLTLIYRCRENYGIDLLMFIAQIISLVALWITSVTTWERAKEQRRTTDINIRFVQLRVGDSLNKGANDFWNVRHVDIMWRVACDIWRCKHWKEIKLSACLPGSLWKTPPTACGRNFCRAEGGPKSNQWLGTSGQH